MIYIYILILRLRHLYLLHSFLRVKEEPFIPFLKTEFGVKYWLRSTSEDGRSFLPVGSPYLSNAITHLPSKFYQTSDFFLALYLRFPKLPLEHVFVNFY